MTYVAGPRIFVHTWFFWEGGGRALSLITSLLHSSSSSTVPAQYHRPLFLFWMFLFWMFLWNATHARRHISWQLASPPTVACDTNTDVGVPCVAGFPRGGSWRVAALEQQSKWNLQQKSQRALLLVHIHGLGCQFVVLAALEQQSKLKSATEFASSDFFYTYMVSRQLWPWDMQLRVVVVPSTP